MNTRKIAAVCVLMACGLPGWCRHFRIDLGYRMLYFGVPNPIIADVYGYSNKKIFLQGDSCEIVQVQDSLYHVTPIRMGRTMLYLRALRGRDTVTLGEREFYVMPPLRPVVALGEKTGGCIPRIVLVAQQGIHVPFNCFDFSLKNYVVAAFTLTILKKDGTYVRMVNTEDGLFSEQMKAMIQSTSSGDRLMFSAIKGRLRNDPQKLKYDMYDFEITVL